MGPRLASAVESSVCWCIIAKPGGGSVQGEGVVFLTCGRSMESVWNSLHEHFRLLH